MRRQNFIRALLFVVFSGIGIAVLAGAILCDDLVRPYYHRQLAAEAARSVARLESLNVDYDVLLAKLQADPNIIIRLAPATLGVAANDVNTAYPKATKEQLKAASRVLKENLRKEAEPNDTVMPHWLSRSCEPRRRIVLFLAGAALILVSFTCFGPAKK